MNYPQPITKKEFLAKLSHLKEVLTREGFTAIYLNSEGAMRWLTGRRHQVIDIHPSQPSTTSVVVSFDKDHFNLAFYSDPWESNRLNDIVNDEIYQRDNISTQVDVLTNLALDQNILHSGMGNYDETVREIVSPLIEQFSGNQSKKLEYLILSSREALLEVAHRLKVGMTGWEIRSLVYDIYHKKHLELNQVVLGLHGMSNYQHPVVQDDSVIVEGDIVKVVTGSRVIEMYHSASQLVKVGKPVTDEERHIYKALLQMSIEYASKYVCGATEKELYATLIPIAERIEKQFDLPHFAQSAHLHHPGGPMSPLGNRDFLVTKDGKRKMFPYSMFSINPVDSILNLKCELQGISIPDSLPMIFDEFKNTTNKDDYMTIIYNDKELRVPSLIQV